MCASCGYSDGCAPEVGVLSPQKLRQRRSDVQLHGMSPPHGTLSCDAAAVNWLQVPAVKTCCASLSKLRDAQNDALRDSEVTDDKGPISKRATLGRRV